MMLSSCRMMDPKQLLPLSFMSSIQGRSARSRRQRILALAAVCLILIFWGGGFYSFINQIPRSAVDNDTSADAIVVLTGGTGRLETGFHLLGENRAPKIFVSGVHEGVDLRNLLQLSQRFPKNLDCCIFLGHEAHDTNGNAIETAAWIMQERARSLLLVTAGYHMPRSLLEFQNAMPGIEILTYPVFPDSVKMERWWLWPGTVRLLIEEYTKYLAAFALSRLTAIRLHNMASTVWF